MNSLMAGLIHQSAVLHHLGVLSSEYQSDVDIMTKVKAPDNVITSKGMFGFVRGQSLHANQLWVYLCCWAVTIGLVIKIIRICIRLYRGVNAKAQFASYFMGMPPLGSLPIASLTKSKTTAAEDVEAQESTPCLVEDGPPEYPTVRQDSEPPTRIYPELPIQSSISPKFEVRRIAGILNAKPVNTNYLAGEDNCAVIDVKVNGQPMRGLIDTGADLSVISVKTAKQLGAQSLNKPTCTVKALGRNLIPILGSLPVNIQVHTRKASQFIIQVANVKIGHFNWNIFARVTRCLQNGSEKANSISSHRPH